jgi:hypothetical protein
MPIADTPVEQFVVALATKWTGEESVLLLPGEETDTPANEHTHSVSTQNKIFICLQPSGPDRTFARTNAADNPPFDAHSGRICEVL